MGKTYIISLCALILAVACTQDDAADKEIRIEGNKATFVGDRVKDLILLKCKPAYPQHHTWNSTQI